MVEEAKSGEVREFTPPTYVTKAETRKGNVRFELQAPDEKYAEKYVDAVSITLKEQFGANPPAVVRQDEADKSKVMVQYAPPDDRNYFEDVKKLARAFAGAEIQNANELDVGYAVGALQQLKPGEEVRTTKFATPTYITRATVKDREVSFELKAQSDVQAAADLALLRMEMSRQFGAESPVIVRYDGKKGIFVEYNAEGRNTLADSGKLVEAFGNSSVANPSDRDVHFALAAARKIGAPELTVVDGGRDR